MKVMIVDQCYDCPFYNNDVCNNPSRKDEYDNTTYGGTLPKWSPLIETPVLLVANENRVGGYR